jgi:predicted nucleotidyltransferase
MDLWIAVHPANASKMVPLIREFGFDVPELSEELFLQKGRIIRMGLEPVRIELLTEISGCEFADCYAQKVEATLDGVPVKIISLADLIKNKLKSGRLKDLDDAERLS